MQRPRKRKVSGTPEPAKAEPQSLHPAADKGGGAGKPVESRRHSSQTKPVQGTATVEGNGDAPATPTNTTGADRSAGLRLHEPVAAEQLDDVGGPCMRSPHVQYHRASNKISFRKSQVSGVQKQ